MPAQLVSLSDEPSILLDKPILLIGRHPECDIQIDSRKVSRRHCCIAQVQDYLVVRDLGSTNGIRINGIRVLEGKLKPKDELTIGGNRYQVSWEVSSEAEDRPRPAARRSSHRERPFQAVEPDEDELLEAAEEPIPLSEPARQAGPHLPQRELPSAKAVEPPPRDSERRSEAAAKNRPAAHIIPEKLDLAPGSDLKFRLPKPPE